MEFGPNGDLHVAWADATRLRVYRFDGGTWHVFIPFEVTSPHYVCACSLAVDTNNLPHIAVAHHTSSTAATLWYVYHDGNDWQTDHFETSSSVSGRYGLSLALDSAGHPWIVHYSGKIAHYSGSTWVKESFDSSGVYPSVNVMTNGQPEVAYIGHSGTYDIMYRQRHSISGWTPARETVDPDIATYYGSTRVRRDPVSGHPRVAFFSTTEDRVRYAAYDGASWTNTTVATGIGGWVYAYFNETPFALDTNGVPHIAYTVSSNTTLYYATMNGAAWTSQPVVDTSSGYSSLALDTNGTPWISYQETGSGLLRIVQLNGGSWQGHVPGLQILARRTMDRDVDGRLDGIELETSIPLNDDFSGATADVSGYGSEAFDTGDVANDEIFWILHGESPTPNTGDTPGVRMPANTTLGDLAGIEFCRPHTAYVVPEDGARPVILAAALEGSNIHVDASENVTGLLRSTNLLDSGSWTQVVTSAGASRLTDTNLPPRTSFYCVRE